MREVIVNYQHREGGAELVNHEKSLTSHRDACEVIDSYPWAEEVDRFEELQEGGGLFFMLRGNDGQQASYQVVPAEKDRGFLFLEVVYKSGFMGIFGRKAVDIDFDLVSISQVKHQIKELFDYSVEGLYNKHKK